MTKEQVEKILVLLKEIDDLAADSRGEYSNARGNDYSCYAATDKIRVLLKEIGK
jgi:hypothetical protein